MHNFDEFRSLVRNDGLARQNRFFIQISPFNLKTESAFTFFGSNDRKLHAFCKGVSLQGVNVATFSHRDTGETFEIPYDRNFTGISLTFYVDRGLLIRSFFDEWVNSIQNPFTRQMSWYNDFVSPTLTVCVLDKQELVNYVIVLANAYPKNISPLELDQTNNETMTFTVLMEYHFYKSYAIPQTDSGVANVRQLNGLPPGAQTRARVDGTSGAAPAPGSVLGGARALQNTLRDSFGGVLNATNAFRDNVLGFQRIVSRGLGELNAIGADIREIVNTPGDIVRSVRGTMRGVESGVRGFRNAFRIRR